MHIPPNKDSTNNKSALTESKFVDEATNELITSGLVAELELALHVINLLSVSVQKSGKKRLILDLRHVNQYLAKQKIKYEN